MLIPPKIKATLIVLALFVLPYFLFISYYAYFNSKVIYLRESKTPWMLNPTDVPVYNEFPMDFPATYMTYFTLTSQPLRARISLNAVTSFTLTVNGKTIATEDDTKKLNWKKPSKYDILPYLVLGQNRVSVYVHSPLTITALKAEGDIECGDGSSMRLDSSDDWIVLSAKEYEPAGIRRLPMHVKLVRHQNFVDLLKSPRPFPMLGWRPAVFALALMAVIGMALFPRILLFADRTAARLIPKSIKAESSKKILYRAVIVIIFIALAVTLYNNFLKCPAERTGDFNSHGAYYEHFLKSFRFPIATEGMAMGNPPGLYFVSAMLFRAVGPVGALSDVIKYAQLVNTICAFLTVLVVFLTLRVLIRDKAVVAATLAVAAFLPMNIYKAVSLSPESIGAFLCSLALYFWLLYSDKPATKSLLYSAIVLGLAFLTRWTAIFVFMGIMAGFFFLFAGSRPRKTRYIKDAVLFCSAIAAVSGWYYLRNIINLNSPFPRDIFQLRQAPGYRDWHFFTSLINLAVNDPLSKSNSFESFLAGTYGTFWYDGQDIFLYPESLLLSYGFVFSFLIIALAILPTILIVRGAFGSAMALGEKENSANGRGAFLLAILILSAVSLAAYVYYAHVYPFYSVAKAYYMLNCISPFMCFLGLGLKGWVSRRGYLLTFIWIVALEIAILKVFNL